MNMFTMKPVTSSKLIGSLIQNTYIAAAFFVVLAILIALLISTIIKWQGYPDTSYKKRRIWWIIVGVVVPVIFWMINATYVSGFIEKSSYLGRFGTCNVIATLLVFAGFFVVSVFSMFCFRSSKWGSILGPTKNK